MDPPCRTRVMVEELGFVSWFWQRVVSVTLSYICSTWI